MMSIKIFHTQYYLFSLLLFYDRRFSLDIIYIKKLFFLISLVKMLQIFFW